ncbi:hypothetical protein EPYR_00636 [Erwinia pyrifoliae DSM 12163]|nr:hypothetical protein EPYR_00636 [Erwinia pyrifoliae DSM 12163]
MRRAPPPLAQPVGYGAFLADPYGNTLELLQG